MAFPSTLSTFNRPVATDRLNSPSHSALHNTVSSALGQVEAVVGVRGDSSVVGTINTAIFSPGSNGGGHIQTAVLGGTGQTTFTKGDILVAQSASVLARLAVGTNNQILTVDSTQSVGLKWIPKTGRVYSSVLSSVLLNTANETSIFSTTLTGSTLGSNGIIKTQIYAQFPGASMPPGASLMFTASYGGTGIASVLFFPTYGGNGSIAGVIQSVTMTTGSPNLQNTTIYTNFTNNSIIGGNSNALAKYGNNFSSVISDQNQTFGVTAKWSGANLQNQLLTDIVFVESSA